jgi:hypothetical protein
VAEAAADTSAAAVVAQTQTGVARILVVAEEAPHTQTYI